jgi:hypothetical protein
MKLWQVTPDAACKTAINRVAKTIRRMTRKKALQLWETKAGNCEVTPQALWPIAKSFMKRDGPKAPIAVHDPLRITQHPKEKPRRLRIVYKTSPHLMTWVTKTTRSPSSVCICTRYPAGKTKAVWHTEISKDIPNIKVLNWMELVTLSCQQFVRLPYWY